MSVCVYSCSSRPCCRFGRMTRRGTNPSARPLSKKSTAQGLSDHPRASRTLRAVTWRWWPGVAPAVLPRPLAPSPLPLTATCPPLFSPFAPPSSSLCNKISHTHPQTVAHHSQSIEAPSADCSLPNQVTILYYTTRYTTPTPTSTPWPLPDEDAPRAEAEARDPPRERSSSLPSMRTICSLASRAGSTR